MSPNEFAIRVVVALVTGGSGNPEPLLSIAQRESNFKHLAVGDVEIASKVFERDKDKIAAKGSPWTDDPDAWAGSFGLFQLMAPYETQRWRADAHPSVLFHPVISTILAMRKWNRAIALGARNAVDVRMVWAFGGDGLEIPHDDERYTSRVKSERERWRKLGLGGDPLDPVQPYAGAGTVETSGQQEQASRAGQRLGIPIAHIPPADWRPNETTTPDEETTGAPKTGSAPIVLAAASALLLLAWQMQRRPSRRLAAA